MGDGQVQWKCFFNEIRTSYLKDLWKKRVFELKLRMPVCVFLCVSECVCAHASVCLKSQR